VAAGKGLWVWTSRGVYGRAKRRGFVGDIERAGGKVFVDTCMVVCPLSATGFSHMVTNSCKAAHYVMSVPGMKASIAELHEVIAGVVEGGRAEG
jgi:predicted aconitase